MRKNENTYLQGLLVDLPNCQTAKSKNIHTKVNILPKSMKNQPQIQVFLSLISVMNFFLIDTLAVYLTEGKGRGEVFMSKGVHIP